ncbi:MAG: ATP-dependent DNA helicase RecG [Flavobacteriales bacterium]
MASDILSTPIEYLKGVGPNRAALLQQELDIYTFNDLLYFFPYKYRDRSRIYRIAQLSDIQTEIQLLVQFSSWEEIGERKKRRLVVHAFDPSGTLALIWFKGIEWIESQLQLNTPYIAFGKPSVFKGKINLIHPEIQPLATYEKEKIGSFQPLYNSTEKLGEAQLTNRVFNAMVKTLIPKVQPYIRESLSPDLRREFSLLGKGEALREIHFPNTLATLQRARFRLKFEELFYIQLSLLYNRNHNYQKSVGFHFPEIGDYFNTFYKNRLNFELTDAQKRVLKEIRRDVNTGHQMNRLLQGDVGSGKTIVAFMSILMALDNGFQAALMAPTEILAQQHFQSLKAYIQGLDISIGLLTGSTKKKPRTNMLSALQSGKLKLITGTHALIQETVQFKNLGLAIVDEQHKFGVGQRAELWQKNNPAPHILVMTATPIPRTLAMSLYGDLDISVIDELPPGRKPIETYHQRDSNRLKVFAFLKKQIDLGRQVYVVYPLIEESENFDLKDLMDGCESLSRYFPPPAYQLSIVHGQMKAQDKAYEMQRFAKGETQIMVATTVIEVGVNVPNASVMVIESAERFGLSQLHQLRGRVGRGSDKSHCILMTRDDLGADSRERIQTLLRTQNGFEIAEADLKLRGPGDLMGKQQSGVLQTKIANIVQDGDIMYRARMAARRILREDSGLEAAKNRVIKRVFQQLQRENVKWSQIS